MATQIQNVKSTAVMTFKYLSKNVVDIGLGYDVSIDENGRVGKKPIHWEYQDDPNRKRLYEVFSALIKLKKEEVAFESEDFTLNTNTVLKRIEINHSDMDVRVIGNFDLKLRSIDPNFSKTDTWYDYFTGQAITVTDVNAFIDLKAGEYHIYTTKQLSIPDVKSAPVASNIAVSGTFREDETLTASYTYTDLNNDPEGSSIYKWYTTGINDILNKELRLYPNPVRDILHLQNLKQVNKLQLFDLSGKAIIAVTMPNESADLNVNNLTTGTYILIFEMEDGSQLSKK
ncbi:T9SS type A sorting domain-containing protein [Labilibaculum euxinus]